MEQLIYRVNGKDYFCTEHSGMTERLRRKVVKFGCIVQSMNPVKLDSKGRAIPRVVILVPVGNIVAFQNYIDHEYDAMVKLKALGEILFFPFLLFAAAAVAAVAHISTWFF